MKLSSDQIRSLLVELTQGDHVVPLSELVFGDIADSKPFTFGPKGLATRKAFAAHFDRWKYLGFDSKFFKKKLAEHNVEVKMTKKTKSSPGFSETASVTYDDEVDSPFQEQEESSDDESTLAETFKSIKFLSPPRKAKQTTKRTPARSTPSKSSRTTPIKYGHGSDYLKESQIIVGMGTKELPYQIHVTRFPERNPLGLWVQPIKRYVTSQYERKGWLIRALADPDVDKWEATIPLSKSEVSDPSYFGRTVQIKKPSIPAHFQDPSAYYDSIKKHIPNCENDSLGNNLKSTHLGILNNEWRHWIYIHLIFPSGVKLQNHILSHQDVKVQRQIHGLTVNRDTTTIPAVGIFWRIAEAGGEQYEESVQPTDFASLW